MPDVKDGRYCRVFGSLRDHEGKKTLMILKMYQVDNINMITNHLLQVIHVRLEAEAMTKEDVSRIVKVIICSDACVLILLKIAFVCDIAFCSKYVMCF